MSNVHTMYDCEPNSAPLPDAWKQYPRRSLITNLPSDVDVVPQYQLYYVGIDGNQAVYSAPNSPSIFKYLGLSCCPCCVPPFFSKEKQLEYERMVNSFCFLISSVQIVMLIISLGLGGFASPNVNPMLGPPASTLIELGAKDSPLMHQGQVWRFVTPIFLHAGIIHITINVFAQMRFGLPMERKWGLIKFIAVYFISGIGGVLMSCLLLPNTISVGASGAIMGLIGCFLGEILMTWMKTDQRTRRLNLIQVSLIIIIIMLISFAPFIDIAAHFGGLLTGFLMGLAYFSRESHLVLFRRFASIISECLLLAFFIIGFTIFYIAMSS